MSEGGYKIKNQSAVHFTTFAVAGWADVFTRKQYRDILVESISFFRPESPTPSLVEKAGTQGYYEI